MSMQVVIDYTKLSMTELHLCQSAIMKEIQTRDQYSQMQLQNIISQQRGFAAQIEAAELRKRDAERKRITLVRILDETCRSLIDFDVQWVEEPEKILFRLKEYAQQSRSEIEKLKAEHEAQISELQLHLTPESPPEVREQRQADIQAS